MRQQREVFPRPFAQQKDLLRVIVVRGELGLPIPGPDIRNIQNVQADIPAEGDDFTGGEPVVADHQLDRKVVPRQGRNLPNFSARRMGKCHSG